MDQQAFEALYADSGYPELHKETVAMTEEAAVLSRFSSPMRLAVAEVIRFYEQEDDYHLRDELEQLARIHVVTYAGLMPGWQSGKLAEWTELAEGDEEQIRLLLTKQLKLALYQTVERERAKECVSLDMLLEYDLEPIDYDQEDRMIERIDNRAEEAAYRDLYPLLARNVLDGMTWTEIAEADDISMRTVAYRIAKEKRAFLMAYVQRCGLRVEGDETMEDLIEAYGYLTDGGEPPEPGLVAA
jgi:hypothetical protein